MLSKFPSSTAARQRPTFKLTEKELGSYLQEGVKKQPCTYHVALFLRHRERDSAVNAVCLFVRVTGADDELLRTDVGFPCLRLPSCSLPPNPRQL